MDPEEKRKELERDILEIIEVKLAKGQMDIARAKQISRMILEVLHPPLSLEHIYAVAPTLDDEFKELSFAVIPFMEEHEEELKKVIVQYAQKLIKSGKFEEANKLLKQEINK